MALPLPLSSSLTFFHPYSPHTQIWFSCPIRSNRGKHWTYSSVNFQYHVATCRSTRVKESPANFEPLIREPHKYFDQVVITVRSGDGGHGAILSLPDQRKASKTQGKHEEKTKRKGSYKRDSDGSLILPMGGHGGDIVIYADESKESLLEFHKKRRYNAKRGGNVNAMGSLTSHLHDGFAAPTLRIPVPVGTVVKRKKGKFLADLARPGDEILVARGGQGGISLLEMPEYKRKRLMTLSSNVMRDENDKVLVLGQPGEEVSLELILRVVADVGLVLLLERMLLVVARFVLIITRDLERDMSFSTPLKLEQYIIYTQLAQMNSTCVLPDGLGLPNAGKSTLLAALTLAKPDIADYPFTTLMPNLGRLDGDPTLGALQYSSEATLADLPGLIEGAHLGKGLGRNFLRHLRRTRLLVHVVDASGEDPVNDYRTVKEELRMYNPNYLERPYIVVLNKIDLPEAQDRLPILMQKISAIGCRVTPGVETGDIQPIESSDPHMLSLASDREERKEKKIEHYPRPLAVVGASMLKHINIDDMLKEIRAALRLCLDLKKVA